MHSIFWAKFFARRNSAASLQSTNPSNQQKKKSVAMLTMSVLVALTLVASAAFLRGVVPFLFFLAPFLGGVVLARIVKGSGISFRLSIAISSLVVSLIASFLVISWNYRRASKVTCELRSTVKKGHVK